MNDRQQDDQDAAARAYAEGCGDSWASMGPDARDIARRLAAERGAVLVNPHTGTARDPRDVATDPAGALIVKVGEPLAAAQARGRVTCWSCSGSGHDHGATRSGACAVCGGECTVEG